MGIFGSNKTTSEADSLVFEDTTDAINSINVEKLSTSETKPAKYGINQATKLVRSFQKHNISTNVIAGIMKQTLASVEIHFTDIIDDAKRKESSVQTESEKKDQQIEDATRKCEALKEEKTKLQQILKETISVREFLLQAMGNDQTNSERVQPVVAQPGDKLEQKTISQLNDKLVQKPTDTQQIEPLPQSST